MQKEIYLPLNSSFTQLQLSKVKKQEGKRKPKHDKFEEDCINCLLQELLLIFFKPNSEQKMYLWQIHSGFCSFQFEFGELPLKADPRYSIDPQNFLSKKCYN
ncbi:MAG: hypothetical protein JO072_05860 [Parafilimonas sp.]|nr:hypothetical protein [Parafilimonas sp.]